MKVYTSIPSDLPPTALTIGNFDGVHLGHQKLLKILRQKASHTTVLTFSNHPREVLQPQKTLPSPLTPTEIKLQLLEQMGIDAVILIPFTLEFASLTYEELLSLFPLSYLVLGAGSTFGKGRLGTEEAVRAFARKNNFLVEYIEKATLDEQPISSTRIRASINSGDLDLASRLLGRPNLKGTYV